MIRARVRRRRGVSKSHFGVMDLANATEKYKKRKKRGDQKYPYVVPLYCRIYSIRAPYRPLTLTHIESPDTAYTRQKYRGNALANAARGPVESYYSGIGAAKLSDPYSTCNAPSESYQNFTASAICKHHIPPNPTIKRGGDNRGLTAKRNRLGV